MDLANKLNGQPLTLTALVVPYHNGNNRDYEGETILYDFQVWHECLLDNADTNTKEESSLAATRSKDSANADETSAESDEETETKDSSKNGH